MAKRALRTGVGQSKEGEELSERLRHLTECNGPPRISIWGSGRGSNDGRLLDPGRMTEEPSVESPV
jgi:hypothetical protein